MPIDWRPGGLGCHNTYSLIRPIAVITPATVIWRIGVIRTVSVIRLIRVTWSIIRPVVVISRWPVSGYAEAGKRR